MSSTTTLANPTLQELVRQYEAVRSAANELTRGLGPAQLNWRPAADRWSICQNIAHLNISARDGFPYLDGMLDRLRNQGTRSEGPYKRTILGRLLVWNIEPPYRTRVKTNPAHVPAESLDMTAEFALFDRNQTGYIERVQRSAGLDIGAVKDNLLLLAGRTKGPAANLTLYDWFLFIAAHQRRHLWQATQVRKNPAFPAG
jgi:DinB family protein